MRLAPLAVVVLLCPVLLPHAPAAPQGAVWFAMHEEALDDPRLELLHGWARAAPAHAAGAPPEGWPRPAPAFAIDPVPGSRWVGTVDLFNLGTDTFSGSLVFEIPELGLFHRGPLELDSQWSPYPLMGGSFTYLLFHPPVPDPAPPVLTLRVGFERPDGTPVGASIEQRFPVQERWCGGATRAHVTYTAGSKDVWFPWDQPWYTTTFCNPTEETVKVAVLARDANTGRPLALHDDTVLLPYAVAYGQVWPSYPTDPEFPFMTSQYLILPPGWYVGYVGFLEDTLFLIDYSPPIDIAPVFTLLWDDGRVEEVEGDTVTFAGVAPPRAPPLPIP